MHIIRTDNKHKKNKINNMNKCGYVNDYVDELDNELQFVCDEDAYYDNRCKFHLTGYLTESTKDEIEKLFKNKISRELKSGKILCVGYILPSINFLATMKNIESVIYFDRATFKIDKINMEKMVFYKYISFRLATFYELTKFNKSVFKNKINFKHAVFKKAVSFNATKFKNCTDFSGSVFNEIDFSYAHFDEVKFNNCKFNMFVNFFHSKFYKNSEFIKTKFYGNGKFNEIVFFNDINFDRSEFVKHFDLSDVRFNKKAITKFNSNLSNVTFINTDIKSIVFGTDTTWKIKENSNNSIDSKKLKCHSKIYEEIQLELKNNNVGNLESIKNIYRDLRDNFDRNLQYDKAGEFFVREMELNRKYIQKNQNIESKPICSQILSPYAVYNALSLYGQSLKRSTCWGIILFIIASGVFSYECHTTMCEQSIQGILLRTISIILPFHINIDKAPLYDVLFKLLFLPVSATFFIAIKRKLERKLRY